MDVTRLILILLFLEIELIFRPLKQILHTVLLSVENFKLISHISHLKTVHVHFFIENYFPWYNISHITL